MARRGDEPDGLPPQEQRPRRRHQVLEEGLRQAGGAGAVAGGVRAGLPPSGREVDRSLNGKPAPGPLLRPVDGPPRPFPEFGGPVAGTRCRPRAGEVEVLCLRLGESAGVLGRRAADAEGHGAGGLQRRPHCHGLGLDPGSAAADRARLAGRA